MTAYLDYAATTPIDEQVLKVLEEAYREDGNCSSLHYLGEVSKRFLNSSRDKIGEIIGANGETVFFTSGGTEANNMIIKGIIQQGFQERKHLITSTIEHPSVWELFKYFEKNGFRVSYLEPNHEGVITKEQLEKVVDHDTLLVSIMLVNNETGMVQPIKELAKCAHAQGALIHSDAVQGFGKLPIDVKDLEVDCLTFSGHKIYGPKGIGGAYIRKGLLLEPLLVGGGQERGRRGGTENLPAIRALAFACEIAEKAREDEWARMNDLGNYFLDKMVHSGIAMQLNHGSSNHSPYIWNICFDNIFAQSLLIRLSSDGIYVSNGSACSSGSVEPSRVLISMGYDKDRAKSSLRFSFGRLSTKDEIDVTVEAIKKNVDALKQISLPF